MAGRKVSKLSDTARLNATESLILGVPKGITPKEEIKEHTGDFRELSSELKQELSAISKQVVEFKARKEKRNKTVHILIPQSLHEQIKAIAEKNKASVNSIINEMLERGVEKV